MIMHRIKASITDQGGLVNQILPLLCNIFHPALAIFLNDSEGGLGIPVVNVILEGGVDTIDTVVQAVQRRTPVILCNGTGRVADILSYATRHAEENG